ncbi:MAG TPA: HEAT repeat domain-containing protein [Candidatus Paceibacterota bacterium]|nr:HEAT repeat domain-containing protein [Verrucomicrobiota bacterium]HRY46703.1 HEAT repeat domain-containing protein [Candidatus Paceibacterota bacterium]
MLIRLALLILPFGWLLLNPAIAADDHSEKTRKLVDVLQSDASFFDKARACQQLGEVGDSRAVAALAALLADEHLSAYARSGLEGIPDPGAAEALRSATAKLKGNLLVGVINSLGVLRDPKAVGLLKQFASDPASGAAKEALLALGWISADESIGIVREALEKEPGINRPDAAAACLLAAEQRLAAGDLSTATALYDAVRHANVALSYRAAATRGAIVARKANGIPLLIEQLRSGDRILRHAALIALREIPSDALAGALNAELDQASAELQVQLLIALRDCHNAQSLPLIQAKTTSEHAEVRKTALVVLGQIGGAAEARALLRATSDNRNPEETAEALNSLRQMEGDDINAQIVQALASAKDVTLRVEWIRLLGNRGATNAALVLLTQAEDPDHRIRVAALRALRSLARSEDLPALIKLTKSSRDDTVREAAEAAVVGLCTRSGQVANGSEAILAEMKQAADPVLKNSWIRILVSLGNAQSLPAILAATKDPNESVAAHAVEQLARWPDPAPMDDLLAVLQTGANADLRKRALTSVIQLASTAADEHQRPESTLIQWLQQASLASQTREDRRLIISVLGRVNHVGSLRLLTKFLDDSELRNEAAFAVVQIAPAVRDADPPALKAALEKIVANSQNPTLRQEAAKIAASISDEDRRLPLFDGRSLAGWEGDTNVWRVKEGVIVGGSLDGNPRNEFLATRRSYTNFILRLEYKLVGGEGFVNGGVQFRSVRVPQPPNEMSGYQADIGAGYSGALYDESRRNKFLAQPADDLIKRLEHPGDWNRYEVRCRGAQIQIMLNDEKTVDYTETDPTIPQTGLIALQIHGNCKAEISFRNLTLQDLSQP